MRSVDRTEFVKVEDQSAGIGESVFLSDAEYRDMLRRGRLAPNRFVKSMTDLLVEFVILLRQFRGEMRCHRYHQTVVEHCERLQRGEALSAPTHKN